MKASAWKQRSAAVCTWFILVLFKSNANQKPRTQTYFVNQTLEMLRQHQAENVQQWENINDEAAAVCREKSSRLPTKDDAAQVQLLPSVVTRINCTDIARRASQGEQNVISKKREREKIIDA